MGMSPNAAERMHARERDASTDAESACHQSGLATRFLFELRSPGSDASALERAAFHAPR